MLALLKRWAENLVYISDVVAIGNALNDGRITPTQASAAIARLDRRINGEPVQVPAETASAPVRRDAELVGV